MQKGNSGCIYNFEVCDKDPHKQALGILRCLKSIQGVMQFLEKDDTKRIFGNSTAYQAAVDEARGEYEHAKPVYQWLKRRRALSGRW